MLEHNRKTLEQLEEYVSKGQDCCVVNPCGSGKSSVMSEFIKNHRNSNMIIFTRQKNADGYYRHLDPVFNDIKVYTYNRMLIDCKKGNTGKYKADFYLADEAHYIGADKWGGAFSSLCDQYSPIVIGFTATPQRFENQGTDETIVTDFFSGNSAGNYTSAQLQEQGVFVEPEYILSLYDIESGIEERLDRLEESDLSEETKAKYRKMLAGVLEDWNRNSNPRKVMKEAIPRYMYKENSNRILVYCPEVENIDNTRKEFDEILTDVVKNDVRSYRYTYKDDETVLEDFLSESKDYVKVLYSVDKIMETVHIDDLSVLLMLRPSVSNRIITQQFGRINSIGNKNKSLIIDMVNNLANIGKLNFLGGATGSCGESANKRFNADIDYVTRYSEVFKVVDQALVKSRYYNYGGFTGSIYQICNIYNKSYTEVKHLMEHEMLDLETALSRARESRYFVTNEIFGGYVEFRDFKLTEEQKALCAKYLPVVERYVRNHDITDEDIIQELHLELFYRISVKDTEDEMRQYLINSINTRYAKLWRHKVVREKVYADKGYHQLDLKYDAALEYKTITDEISKKGLPEALKTLSEREQKVLALRFGFERDPMTLEEIGKMFNVNRERIRQIEAKALRKLRHPSRLRMIGDVRNDLEEYEMQGIREIVGKKERTVFDLPV